MRIAALVCCIIVLAQVFLPCSDKIQVSSYLSMAVSNTAAAHSDSDSHKKAADQCSPFCQCNCCATPTIIQHAVVIVIKQAVYPYTYTSYVSSAPSAVHVSIWQPPKLTA